MLIILCIAAGIILALILTAWFAELQATVYLVLDKGGLWFWYSIWFGRIRLTGFQIRLMNGHKPRAWTNVPFSSRLKKAEFGKTVETVSSERWNPIQIRLKSVFDIGIKIIIREMNVKAAIGVEGDAAATALLCGGLATLLDVLRIVSTRGKSMPKGKIFIKPVFNRARLSIRFKCILAIKARHIIREILESYARRKKDGQSSNRKHHANHNGKYTEHG